MAKTIFSKESIVSSLMGASVFKDFLKTKEGQEVLSKISSKILGIGPGDEALFKKAYTFLVVNILSLEIGSVQAKGILKKINNFMQELEENGYSRWWFRNVLATMKQGDAEGENQAAMTLYEIIQGNSFQEMVDFAGPDLIHKTYKKKVSEGWEFVYDKAGKLSLLIDSTKIFNGVFNGIKESAVNAKEEFKSGVKVGCRLMAITFSVLAIISLLLIHC